MVIDCRVIMQCGILHSHRFCNHITCFHLIYYLSHCKNQFYTEKWANKEHGKNHREIFTMHTEIFRKVNIHRIFNSTLILTIKDFEKSSLNPSLISEIH